VRTKGSGVFTARRVPGFWWGLITAFSSSALRNARPGWAARVLRERGGLP